MVTVGRITTPQGIALEDIAALLSQLRRSPGDWNGTKEDVERAINDTRTIFIVARDGSKVVGMGMVFMAPKFGEALGFVENIVVLDSYRSKGLGRTIMELVIDESRKAGVTRLDLTSNPSRVAANALYQSLGFEKRDTNVYLLHV